MADRNQWGRHLLKDIDIALGGRGGKSSDADLPFNLSYTCYYFQLSWL